MSTLRNKKLLNSKKYHHGDLASALKKKALSIIKTKGFSGLNLRDLAKSCGVSSTAVYRHYKSKDQLLAIVAEEALDELQCLMMQETNPKRVQKMGLAYIQFALNHPLRFRLCFENIIDKKKFPVLSQKHQQTYKILQEEIKKHVANNIMDGDIDKLTLTAWTTVHGMAMLFLEEQVPQNMSGLDPMQIAYDVTSIVGRGLGRID